MTRSVIQLGGQALKLDADGDTTIQVSSDDILIVDTAGNEALKIDANGHVTEPKQSAFLASPSSNITNIAVRSDTTIVFDTVIFDQNGDYDNSTGIFTAPVTGRYAFYFNTRVESLPTNCVWWQWSMVSSNTSNYMLTSQQFGSAIDYFGQNNIMFLDMDANDTTLIQWYQNYGDQQVDINAASTKFGGHLVC